MDEAYATYPCKIIHTRRAGKCTKPHSAHTTQHANGKIPAMSPPVPAEEAAAAAVYVTSYGGGLFPGDSVRMQLRAHAGSTAQVASQGFNKVHAADPHAQRQRLEAAKAQQPRSALPTSSSRTDAFSTQTIDASVASDALLLWLPEPTMIYAGASFRSNSVIELQCQSTAGSVVWLDWLYAGRTARGEVFDFAAYHNRTHVHAKITNSEGNQELVPIILEALKLEQTTGAADATNKGPAAQKGQGVAAPSSLATRLSPYHSYVSVLLLGPRVASLAASIHAHISRSRVDAVPSSRHGRGASEPAASRMPRVMFSSQWIDVPIESSNSPSMHAASPVPSPSSSLSRARLTGCYLRVSSVTLEESAAVLRDYLSSLDSIATVPTPWQMFN